MDPRGEGDGQEEGGEGAGVGPAVFVNPASIDVTVSPAKEIVQALIDMGIDRSDAQLAVRQTGCNSVENAISWVFENREGSSRVQMEDIYQDYKMVFVVNTSLPMTPGKIAAQVAHAAVDLYQTLMSNQEENGLNMSQWLENGAKKVVLSGENEAQLLQLESLCIQAKLPKSLIQDAGLTQIPSGSRTVLGVFGAVSEVDKVTGKLRTL